TSPALESREYMDRTHRPRTHKANGGEPWQKYIRSQKRQSNKAKNQSKRMNNTRQRAITPISNIGCCASNRTCGSNSTKQGRKYISCPLANKLLIRMVSRPCHSI